MHRGIPENRLCRGMPRTPRSPSASSPLTSEASHRCMKEKRKTMNEDDLIWSMSTLGFQDYVEPLNLYLKLYWEPMEMHGGHLHGRVPGTGSVNNDADLIFFNYCPIHRIDTKLGAHGGILHGRVPRMASVNDDTDQIFLTYSCPLRAIGPRNLKSRNP